MSVDRGARCFGVCFGFCDSSSKQRRRRLRLLLRKQRLRLLLRRRLLRRRLLRPLPLLLLPPLPPRLCDLETQRTRRAGAIRGCEWLRF
jgi:hypothetical protein